MDAPFPELVQQYMQVTAEFLYGAGPETLIVVTGALGKFCPRAEKPETVVYTQKTKKNRGLGIRC